MRLLCGNGVMMNSEIEMSEIEIIDPITDDHVQKAVEMDHAAFRYEDWISEEDAVLIYRIKRNCLIWLTQNDEPAGFVTVFPLNKTVAARAVGENKPMYKLLTEDVLEDPATDILYCHCFLLLSRFRGKGLIYKLYEGLGLWLEKNGVRYSRLYADAVSPEGQRCLERLGFNPVHSFGANGTLYKADKEDVLNAIIRR
jgi:GNAT superfamily N-acetyltransferase